MSTASTTFKIGDSVSFMEGAETRTAVVTKIDAMNIHVYGGSIWSMELPKTAPDLTRTSKRVDSRITRDIRHMYANLSPENLHCDGEVSPSQAAVRAANYNRILKALFVEIGRTVSESEAYQQA